MYWLFYFYLLDKGKEGKALTIPIYQKHLTQEDIAALNKFYDSPAGKKMIKVQPLIMQESMAVGQAWGQKIAQEVINKYQAEKP